MFKRKSTVSGDRQPIWVQIQTLLLLNDCDCRHIVNPKVLVIVKIK